MKTTDTQPIAPPEDGCPPDEWKVAIAIAHINGLAEFEHPYVGEGEFMLACSDAMHREAVDDFNRRQAEHMARGGAQFDALLDGMDQSESKPVEASLQDVHSDEEVTQTFEPTCQDVDGKFDNGGDL